MGHTTDLIGHIDITPPLNDAEVTYLTAFSQSRRCYRPEGPYAVPGNPFAYEGMSTEQENRRAAGQPGYWCKWVPCWDGCCLAFNGHEKFYNPVRWLEYLIEHFLKPGAVASASGLPWFAGFTFDHVLDGMVVGCRRDNKDLFAITVVGNEVTREILRPADGRYVDFPPLPYEDEIDRWEAESRSRRRRRESGAVIDLAARRP